MRRLELMFSLGLVQTPVIVDYQRQMAEAFREFAQLAAEHAVSDDFLQAVLRLSERNISEQRPPLEIGVGA